MSAFTETACRHATAIATLAVANDPVGISRYLDTLTLHELRGCVVALSGVVSVTLAELADDPADVLQRFVLEALR